MASTRLKRHKAEDHPEGVSEDSQAPPRTELVPGLGLDSAGPRLERVEGQLDEVLTILHAETAKGEGRRECGCHGRPASGAEVGQRTTDEEIAQLRFQVATLASKLARAE